MFKLSQETIAIVTVGLALATLIVTGDAANRAEARAAREALRAEARADRAEAQAARDAIRTEAQAARDALRAEAQAARDALRAEARADREAFEQHITRLTQGQSRLTGIVEQMCTAGR